MSASACIITNQPRQKHKLTKFLRHHPLIAPNFPRNLQQIFELIQQSDILLIVIAIKESPIQATKICHALKKHPLTHNTPIVLVKYRDILEKHQLADAYLTKDFSLQDFNQILRQLTMGY